MNLADASAARSHISTAHPRSSKLCANSLSSYCEAQVVWLKSWKGLSICYAEICPLAAPLHLTLQGEWIIKLQLRELFRWRQNGTFN